MNIFKTTLVALSGLVAVASFPAAASAMPVGGLAIAAQTQSAPGVDQVRLVCGYYGCHYVRGWRRPYYHRYYRRHWRWHHRHYYGRRW